MSAPLEGQCHCGKLGLSVGAGGFGVVACHCQDCQRLHGNYFAMVVVDAEQVRWRGEEYLCWYWSSTQAQRGFCSHCGARVAKRPEGAGKLMLSMGLFGPNTGMTVRKNVHTQSKPDWYELEQESQA